MRASRTKSMQETLRRARECAALTVTVRDEELAVERHRTGNFGTIAIVNEEALLCEIGLGKSRPYREGWHTKEGVRTYIAKRREVPLAIPNYESIGRRLLLLLQEFVDERVSEWKSLGFYLPHTKNHMSRRQKTYLRSVKYKPVVRGVRFSVPIESEIARDLAWAELYENKDLVDSLSGLARYIDLTLTHHYVRRKQWRGKTFFRNLVHVKECVAQIQERKLKARHLERLFDLYPGGAKSSFLPHLKYLFGINGARSPERMLADRASAGVHERVKGLKVEVISLNTHHGYLVAEIFPSREYVKKRLAEEARDYANACLEEVPF